MEFNHLLLGVETSAPVPMATIDAVAADREIDDVQRNLLFFSVASKAAMRGSNSTTLFGATLFSSSGEPSEEVGGEVGGAAGETTVVVKLDMFPHVGNTLLVLYVHPVGNDFPFWVFLTWETGVFPTWETGCFPRRFVGFCFLSSRPNLAPRLSRMASGRTERRPTCMKSRVWPSDRPVSACLAGGSKLSQAPMGSLPLAVHAEAMGLCRPTNP